MRDPAEMTTKEIDHRRRLNELDNMARHLLIEERDRPGTVAAIAAMPPDAQRSRLWESYAGIFGARLVVEEDVWQAGGGERDEIVLVDEEAGRQADGVPHVCHYLGVPA